MGFLGAILVDIRGKSAFRIYPWQKCPCIRKVTVEILTSRPGSTYR